MMHLTAMLAALATVMKSVGQLWMKRTGNYLPKWMAALDWQLWMESQNHKYRPNSCMPRFAHPIEIILCKPTWDMYVGPTHKHPPRHVMVRVAGGTKRLQRVSKADLLANRSQEVVRNDGARHF